jgi:hypothetical protein
MHHPYQFSHEELLLLLGLLRLPSPMALGARPAAGYSQATLHVAMGAAAGSLAARDLLNLPDDVGAPPQPQPRLARDLRAALTAAGSLTLAGGQGGRARIGEICLCGDAVWLLDSPRPGAYTLGALPNHAAGADHVVGLLAAPVADPPAASLRLTPAALLAALAAAPAGGAAVIAQLSALPAAEAAAFAWGLGAAPARYALVALRGPDGRRERCGAFVVVGSRGAWYADDAGDELLALRPAGPAELRARVAALIDWAVESGAAPQPGAVAQP